MINLNQQSSQETKSFVAGGGMKTMKRKRYYRSAKRYLSQLKMDLKPKKLKKQQKPKKHFKLEMVI